MIKLKTLLSEVIITTREFDSVVNQAKKETGPVSYTHLTLPTKA